MRICNFGRSFRVLALFCCLIASGAGAYANPACRSLVGHMADNTLYSARCHNHPGCLEEVVETGATAVLKASDGKTRRLQKAQRYNFVYRVPAAGAANSLVIAQIKQLDAGHRAIKPSKVRMQRYPISFACVGRRQNESLPQWPHSEVRGRDLPSVDYDRYDAFHRNGFTTSDEDHVLRSSLHVRYHNGQACVSTQDPVRRAQFLLHDHKSFAWRTGTFFLRVGLYTTTATGDEYQKVAEYKRLKVIVTNYRQSGEQPRCFSFSTKAGRPESTRLDISIRDIEKQAAAYPYDLTRQWSFELE